jgi:hypothetical protein
MMKKSLLLLLNIALLTVTQPGGFGQAMGCDQESKELVLAAYAGAMTRPDDFPISTRKNSNMFVSANQWQNCIVRLSNALKQHVLSGPSPNEIRESAYNIASSANAPEKGEILYRQMMETSSDMLALARHLDSLSVSIRAILDDNFSTYYNSEVYRMSSFVWQSMEYAWGWQPGAVEMYRRLFYQMYVWYLRQLMQVI